MRLSTSSSEAPLPTSSWIYTWVFAGILTGLALGVWETFWRGRGFVPSVVEDNAAWIIARLGVRSESTVLVGSSRMQSGVDPEVWGFEADGRKPVQLAKLGTSPIPVLEDLAGQRSYTGLAVVEFASRDVFGLVRGPERAAANVVREYRSALNSPAKLSEAVLGRAIGARFAFLNPALSPKRMLKAASSGVWPEAPHFAMRRDRFRPVDFSKTDPERWMSTVLERRIRYVPHRPTDAEMASVLDRIGRAVSPIETRGGRVVFLNFPTCGKIREIDERRFPRDLYWDRLAAATTAIMIHADDYPSLTAFNCPDGEHLDQRDTRAFTQALARIVKYRVSAS